MFAGPSVRSEALFKSFLLTEQYYGTDLKVLASIGKKKEDNFFNFLFQIDNKVWYCFAFSFSSLVLSSAVIEISHSNKPEEFFNKAYNYFWIYCAALFCEGSPRTPPNRRNQLLLLSWLLAMVVLSSLIVSQFKASIMVTENEDYIRTIQDIVDRPQIMPMALKMHMNTALRNSPLPQYQELYKRILEHSEPMDLESFCSPKTYQKIKDGESVLITLEVALEICLSLFCTNLKGSRQFYYIDESFFPHEYVFMFNKEAPPFIINVINRRIFQYRASGVHETFLKKFKRNYWKCIRHDELEGETRLEFKHLSSVFYLLSLSHAFSTLVLFIEIGYYKYQEFGKPYFKEN